MKRYGRQALGLVLALLLACGGMFSPVRDYLTMPEMQRVTTDEKINCRLPLDNNVLDVQTQTINDAGFVSVNRDNNIKWIQMQFKLFGLVPLKNITFQIVKPVFVYPGGHAIGILLQTEGVQVIGEAGVIDSEGKKNYPARQSGIKVGDNIISVDGKKINSDYELAMLINNAGFENRKIQLTIKRDGEIKKLNLQPMYCHETDRYRIGIFVRDSTAGVGTLTFYDKNKKIFGALGHVVTDGNGNQELNISGGKIVAATIHGIHQGKKGQPGEKTGIFIENSKYSGIIKKNTPVGIFGILQGNIPSEFKNPIPVSLIDEIKTGYAQIMTVIDGEKVEKFDIEIEKIMPYQKLSGKGMIIRITDPRLISLTGGIIQGMSGSPIIQDGSLVGAVTHVFVNDPTKGYGVFAEWMLEEISDLINTPEEMKEHLISSGIYFITFYVGKPIFLHL